SYYWQFNNTLIPGATNASLILNPVHTNDAGTYSVIINNVPGSVTSSDALLTVNPTCVPATPGLVACGPTDGNTLELINGNDGSASGGLAFASGESGQAFSFDGIDDAINIMAASSLDVGAGTGLTIECWIKPTNVSSSQAIVEWNDGTNPGVHLW